MKKLILGLLLSVIVLAQTGNVYITTPEEKEQIKAAFMAVKIAQANLDTVKDSIRKNHKLKKDVSLDFNKEYTTFNTIDIFAGGASPGYYTCYSY